MQKVIGFKFETKDLILRPYELDDIDELKAALEESYESLNEFLPFAEKEKSKSDLYDFVLMKTSQYYGLKDFTIGIFAPDNKTVLGGTGFHPRERAFRQRCVR